MLDAQPLLIQPQQTQNIGVHSGNVSATGGAELTFLKELPNLKSLWLDDDQLSEEGVTILRELPTLERLFLTGEGINDATLVLLEELPNLAFLFLQSTSVTENGLTRLGNLKKLESLSLSHLDWERATQTNRSSRMRP